MVAPHNGMTAFSVNSTSGIQEKIQLEFLSTSN